MDVSFVIPCHNGGEFLEAAVDSIWSQAAAEAIREIIIVDDCSDSETVDVLAALSERQGIRVIRNHGENGPGAARNLGVESATTEWIAFLDADDMLTPGSLQRRMDAAERLCVQWVGGEFDIWWPTTGWREAFFATRPRSTELLGSALHSTDPTRFHEPLDIFYGTPVTHVCSTLIAKSLFDALGGFDNRFPWVEDYHFFLRAAAVAPFAFVPQSLFVYRQNGESTTSRRQPWAPADWHLRVFRDLANKEPFRRDRSRIRKRLAEFHSINSRFYRVHGRRLAATREAFAGLWADPGLSNLRRAAAALLGPLG